MRPHTLMIGGGPLFEDTRSAIQREGLQDQITISDGVPHAELLRIMQASDVLVMASTHEGFPLVPAEAMLLRKPVLATTVGGLPELIENNVSGILIPPGDPQALAQAIEQLTGDPDLRHTLGEAGRQRVLAKLCLKVLVPRWEMFYKDVIDS